MCFTAMLEQLTKMVPSTTWGKLDDSIRKILPLTVENYDQTSMCKYFSIAEVYHSLYVLV